MQREEMSEEKRTIWKFPIKLADYQEVLMPEFSDLLSAQYQDDTLCLWAQVSPEKEKLLYTVMIKGTGFEYALDSRFKYFTTVQSPPFVWHLFVEKRLL